MNSIKNALTRKLGPLPAWGWLGIAGAGIFWWRSRHNSTTAAAGTQTPAYVGPWGQTGGGTIGGGGSSGGGGSGGGGGKTGGPFPGGGPGVIHVHWPKGKGKRNHKPEKIKGHARHHGGKWRNRPDHIKGEAHHKGGKFTRHRHPATQHHPQGRKKSGSPTDTHADRIAAARTQAHSSGQQQAKQQVKPSGSQHPNSAGRHK